MNFNEIPQLNEEYILKQIELEREERIKKHLEDKLKKQTHIELCELLFKLYVALGQNTSKFAETKDVKYHEK